MRVFLVLALVFSLFSGPNADAQDLNVPGPSVVIGEEEEPNPYENVPDEFIIEANNFHAQCSRSARFKRFYDCECLAVEYLDARIENPTKSQEAIIASINKTCPDATQAAGEEFNKCLGRGPLLPRNIDLPVFCECYANTYATLYETYPVSPNSKTFVALKTEATVACLNPNLAREVFSDRTARRKK